MQHLSKIRQPSWPYLKKYISKGVTRDEHRIIMERHLGRTLESNEVVHHINENQRDNRLENLQVMSRAEHTRMHNTGRPKGTETRRKISLSKAGERHPLAKLTNDKVKYIRLSPLRNRQLANELGLCEATICLVRKGKLWAHVHWPIAA